MGREGRLNISGTALLQDGRRKGIAIVSKAGARASAENERGTKKGA